MLDFAPKEGAYVNTLSLILYYRHFGVHPVSMPWQFSDRSPEELLSTFQKVADEDLEAAPY